MGRGPKFVTLLAHPEYRFSSTDSYTLEGIYQSLTCLQVRKMSKAIGVNVRVCLGNQEYLRLKPSLFFSEA